MKERDHLEYLGVDGNIISKRIFNKRYGISWAGFFWLIAGTGGVLL